VTETFKVGQVVEHRTFGRGEIAYGPFDHHNGPNNYLMKQSGGRHVLVMAEGQTAGPAFVVGDEVEYTIGPAIRGKIVAGPFKSEYHDTAIYVVEKANGTHMTPTENALCKVGRATFEYDGVVYDLTAGYRDRDGDVWRFTTPDADNPRMTCDALIEDRALPHVERAWGPLTRI
jgi:hypothetical protein